MKLEVISREPRRCRVSRASVSDPWPSNEEVVAGLRKEGIPADKVESFYPDQYHSFVVTWHEEGDPDWVIKDKVASANSFAIWQRPRVYVLEDNLVIEYRDEDNNNEMRIPLDVLYQVLAK